jgi:hypothetical protein
MSNEWVMVPREPTANQLVDGAYEVPDPISHRGELTARMVYRAMLDAAPQQAEPVSYAVFDPSGEVVYAALYKIRCVEYADNEYRYGHSAAKNWAVRPVFAHPPAAEVQRMREALGAILKRTLDASSYRSGQDVHDIARRALEGK